MQAANVLRVGAETLKIWFLIVIAFAVANLGAGELAVGPSGEKLGPPYPSELMVASQSFSSPSGGVIRWIESSPAAAQIAHEGQDFQFWLQTDPRTMVRAFLVYQLEGLPHWTGAVRAIHEHPPQGGFIARTTSLAEIPSGVQVEEIHPGWLRSGANVVRFEPSPQPQVIPDGVTDLRQRHLGVAWYGDASLSYGVKNLRLVLVEDDGRPLTTDAWAAAPAPSALAAVLVDDDLATGWPGGDDPKSFFPGTLDLPFQRLARPQTLEIAVSGRLEGQLLFEVLRDDGIAVAASGLLDLSTLAPGWHHLPLDDDLPAAVAVRLSWSGAQERGGEILEIDLLAESLGIPVLPRLTLTSPRPHDESVEGACLRGFVELPATDGAAELFADGVYLPNALAGDGAFEVFVPRRLTSSGPWTVELEIRYGDNRTLRKQVRLGGTGRDGSDDWDDGRKKASHKVMPGKWSKVEHAGARLKISPGALAKETTLTTEALNPDEVAVLDSGMTNVTAPHPGFRFGPDDHCFAEPIEITLPFALEALPEGMSPEDIRTFFFDEEAGRWVKLERLSIDFEELTVTSLTDHFTDFINATLVLPDHPSGTSFAPNSIKELKLGDAAAGITLIEPPAAGPTGGAEISFPLQLPPGRRGMAPKLTVTYSSDAGNGWMGLGWNLATSAIEVDTLFGVPRYSATTETETYRLDGAFLTPTDPDTSRQSERTFVRRVENSFERIVRHGDHAASYWWEVTDKDGTRRIYGRTQQARLQSYRDPYPVFRWYLEQVVDVLGNTIDYSYFTDAGTSGEPWTQVYPSAIHYTGVNGSGGYYQVQLVLDDAQRPDRLSSGRSGFKVYTRYRLVRVDILAGGTLVRRYLFEYQEGDFGKSLLEAIAVSGEDGQSELYRHSFDYFSMPTDGDGFDGFAEQEAWPGMRWDGDCNMTANAAAGGHVFVGVGPPGSCDPHVGRQVGGSVGGRTTLGSFIDMNGDGLTDRLFSDGRLELNSFDTATGGQGRFQEVSFPGVPLLPLPTLGSTMELTFDVAVGAHLAQDQIQAGTSWAWNHSLDTRMLSDINGDGFTDLVATEPFFSVYLNDRGQELTPQSQWHGFSIDGLDLGTAYERHEVLEGLRLADPLRKLVLPYSGTVTLDGDVYKITDAGQDGVKVSIYHNHSRLWRRAFARDNTTPCTPGPDDSCGNGLTLEVAAGDRLYFLADAVEETSGDDLAWIPRVRYTDLEDCSGDTCPTDSLDDGQLAMTEPFGAPLFIFDAADDFHLAGANGGAWAASASGEVQILGSIHKQPTADDVVATIRKNGEVIHRLELAAAEEGEIEVTTTVSVTRVQLVEIGEDEWQREGDLLSFHLESDNQVDPSRVHWTPTVTYEGGLYCRPPIREGDPEICGAVSCEEDPATGDMACTLAGDSQSLIPILAEEVYQPAQVQFPVHRLLPREQPTQYWQAPAEGTFKIKLAWTAPMGGSAPVLVYLQGVHHLIDKRRLAPAGELIFADNFETGDSSRWGAVPGPNAGQSYSVTVDLAEGERLYITALADTLAELGTLEVETEVDGTTVELPFNMRYREDGTCSFLHGPCDPFPGGFHGWRYGEWNGEGPFRESALSDTSTDKPRDFATAAPRWQGIAGLDEPVWTAAGFDLYLSADGSKPSRWGMNAAAELDRAAGKSAPGAKGGSPLLLRMAYGRTSATEISAFGIGGNLALGLNTTTLDLLDVNGDRYPDQVAPLGLARFSDGSSSFGIPELVPHLNAPYPCSDGMEFLSDPYAAVDELLGLAGRVRCSKDGTVDSSISLGIPIVKKNSDGEVKEVANLMPALGKSTSLSQGRVDLIDVNGDNLPDRVAMPPGSNHIKVRLNLGYRFGEEELWPLPSWTWTDWDRCHNVIDFLDSEVLGLIGSLNRPDALSYSLTSAERAGVALGPIGGGVGTSLTRTLVDLVDINGDGLPDHVSKDHGQDFFRVKLNYGDHWGAEHHWSVPAWEASMGGIYNPIGLYTCLDAVSLSGVVNGNASLGLSHCFTITPVTPVIGIQVEGSLQAGGGVGGVQLLLQDIDGDGLPDHVLKTGFDTNVYVKRNQAAKVNLLRSVTRPLGGSFTLDYRRHGNRVDYKDPGHLIDMPRSQWVLASVALADGRGNTYTRTYDYFNDAYHDRAERVDYGYAHIRETRPDGATIDNWYHNQDLYSRNLPAKVLLADKDGLLFQRKTSKYQLRPVADGSFFPALMDETTCSYEGTTTSEHGTAKCTTQS
jgi:hypothetical protein